MNNLTLKLEMPIEHSDILSETLSATVNEGMRGVENEINLEEFVIVWMDVNNGNDSNRNMRLRSIVNYLKPFDNVEECIDYIRSTDNEKIFLITSGLDGKNVVKHVHDLPQVATIYIFCSDMAKHKEWASSYVKICGVFENDDLLLDKLNNDIVLYSNSLMSISFFKNAGERKSAEKSTQALSKELATYMWINLLTELLVRLPVKTTNEAKQDMINECRLQYKKNISELRKIDDFNNNYTTNNAIAWYTRDCFLYRLLNKAFRTQNIDFIFKYRFFIADLYNQLTVLHSESTFPTNDDEKILTVYRGQWMTRDELRTFQENINELISINTFFSTSMSSEIACGFADGVLDHPYLESVLMEISIDTTISTRPFANVKDLSFLKNENEVLLLAGTIFHVDEVEKNSDTLWYIKLTLANYNDEKFRVLNDFFKQEIEVDPTLFTFGVFLTRMGEPDKAERYYRLLLKELSETDPELGSVYNNIGICYDKKGDFVRALTNYQHALLVYSKTFLPDHMEYAYTYTNIGSCYFKMGDYEQAMENYGEALSIKSKYVPSTHSSCASLLCNIGEVWRHFGDINNALNYYAKALKASSSSVVDHHPHTAIIYNNMGLAYQANHEYKLALENYQKALDIQQSFLPASHPDLALTFINIGAHYHRERSFEEALDYYSKALNIQLNILPCHHPETAATYSNIACVHITQKKYEEALKNLENALEIQIKAHSPSIYITYHNIGTVYHSMKSYQLAITNYKKEVELCSPSSGMYYLDLIKAYNHIADAYKQENFFDEALENYNKALTTSLKYFRGDHLQIQRTFDTIGNLCFQYSCNEAALKNYQTMLDFYCHNFPDHLNIACAHTGLARAHQNDKDYDSALVNLHRALEIKVNKLTPDDCSIGTTHNNIGEVYRKMGNYEQAKNKYNEALHIYEKSLSADHPAFAIIYQNIALLTSNDKA